MCSQENPYLSVERGESKYWDSLQVENTYILKLERGFPEINWETAVYSLLKTSCSPLNFKQNHHYKPGLQNKICLEANKPECDHSHHQHIM